MIPYTGVRCQRETGSGLVNAVLTGLKHCGKSTLIEAMTALVLEDHSKRQEALHA